MAPENCIKVKRDGPRGWHWIAADSFDPATHELADTPVRAPTEPDAKKVGTRKKKDAGE